MPDAQLRVRALYPTSEANATARALARYVAASAHQALTEILDSPVNDSHEVLTAEAEKATRVTAEFGLVHALCRLNKIDPAAADAAADAAAREIWCAWEAGDTVAERIWQYLAELEDATVGESA